MGPPAPPCSRPRNGSGKDPMSGLIPVAELLGVNAKLLEQAEEEESTLGAKKSMRVRVGNHASRRAAPLPLHASHRAPLP